MADSCASRYLPFLSFLEVRRINRSASSGPEFVRLPGYPPMTGKEELN
jgi:hypothetical protein